MTAAFESPRQDPPCGKRADGLSSTASDNGRPGAERSPDSHVTAAPLPPWQLVDALGTQIEFGNAGDHTLVHQLLRAVHQGPSQEAFLSLLDEPSYEPADRLLIKRHGQVLSHVQLTRRVAWFAGNRLPIGGMLHLATLPEYRASGLSARLLLAADAVMGEDGAVLGVIRTSEPAYFEACGWVAVGHQQFSQANTRDILSYLQSRPPQRTTASQRLTVRTWRHVEFEALRRVYRHAVRDGWGAIDRTESYWQWLVGRKSHEQLLVALREQPPLKEEDQHQSILGYAVVSGARIVELQHFDAAEEAAAALLKRVCRDAIERDHHAIALHAPPAAPLHDTVITAGGSWVRDPSAVGGTLMVKLLNAEKWIQHMEIELLEQVRSHGLPRPAGIDFLVGDRGYRLQWTNRSVRLTSEVAGVGDVRCDPCAFAKLLVGSFHHDDEASLSALQIERDEVREMLRAMFPLRQFWQSPFDLLHV